MRETGTDTASCLAPDASSSLPDITSRPDIVRMVDAFYDRVRHDEILGPIFNDIARVDWGAHLPKMYDFWGAVLFAETNFTGNPLAVHYALSQQTPLTSREFVRWVHLFHETVDTHFAGPMADEAKRRAARIAITMHHHLAVMREAGVTTGS